jgi:hypothetical protein
MAGAIYSGSEKAGAIGFARLQTPITNTAKANDDAPPCLGLRE